MIRSLIKAIEKAIQGRSYRYLLLSMGASWKENIPKIIHSSHEKHGKYIAVNCGAIPA
jgi:transcriptional regulator of acetoin/glycerol metabolism